MCAKAGCLLADKQLHPLCAWLRLCSAEPNMLRDAAQAAAKQQTGEHEDFNTCAAGEPVRKTELRTWQRMHPATHALHVAGVGAPVNQQPPGSEAAPDSTAPSG